VSCVCPWWFTYTFDNPLRRLLHDPERLLSTYVSKGMRAADIGCGMGHFTIGLARLVGPSGRVCAVDLQSQQLARVRRRAARAGVEERVELVMATDRSLGLSGAFDFVLAFWMLHEAPSEENFFAEVHACMSPGAALLLAEPILHVTRARFDRSVAIARRQGFAADPVRPRVRLSRAALLIRTTD